MANKKLQTEIQKITIMLIMLIALTAILITYQIMRTAIEPEFIIYEKNKCVYNINSGLEVCFHEVGTMVLTDYSVICGEGDWSITIQQRVITNYNLNKDPYFDAEEFLDKECKCVVGSYWLEHTKFKYAPEGCLSGANCKLSKNYPFECQTDISNPKCVRYLEDYSYKKRCWEYECGDKYIIKVE